MFDTNTLVSLIIVAGVAFAIWRQGQANPVGTARVQKDIAAFDQRLTRVEATVERIESEVSDAPTAADIATLRGDIKALAAVTDGVNGHVQSVDAAVVRIEMLINGLTPAVPTRRRK